MTELPTFRYGMKRSRRKLGAFEIAPVSKEGIEVIKNIVQMAVDNNMLSASDANSALRILTVNPQSRLSVLGRRLARLVELVESFKNMDSRLTDVAENTSDEFNALVSVINSNELWEKKYEDEEEEEQDKNNL
jgi:hypothetical protein